MLQRNNQQPESSKKLSQSTSYTIGLASISLLIIAVLALMYLHSTNHQSHADHANHTATAHGTNHANHVASNEGHATQGESFYTTFEAVSQTTLSGLHRVELTPANTKVPLIEIHHWFVRIFDQSDKEIRPQRLQISGGMPAHGHGFPTLPAVQTYTKTHGYRISNVSFNMAGEWKFVVAFNYEGVNDKAEFDIDFPTSNGDSTSAIRWSELDKRLLRSLSIHTGRLEKIVRGNDVALSDKAASLGHQLFFDKRLSRNSDFACVSCHLPDKYFTDGLITGQGSQKLSRNTPSVVGSVYQNWLYWDGRRDSLWSQALVPMEAVDEMGGDRLSVARLIAEEYLEEYESVFDNFPAIRFEQLPSQASPMSDETAQSAWQSLDQSTQAAINTVFANTGKAIAAYETRLLPAAGRFDTFVDALLRVNDGDNTSSSDAKDLEEHLSYSEQRGLKLFISDRTQCLNCHASAMFTNFGFHNIGTAQAADHSYDYGRIIGVQSAILNEFNCNSIYSSDESKPCQLLDNANIQNTAHSARGAFRVPTLRGLTLTAPYMHDGRFNSLEEVVRFYSDPKPQLLGKRHELPNIEQLSDNEISDLIAFLQSLGELVAVESAFLQPPPQRQD